MQGFLTIQQAVDMILIKSLGGEVSAMKSFLKIFPFPPYMADKFIFILQTQLPFLLMVSFSVIAPTICSEIVYEKESKLKVSGFFCFTTTSSFLTDVSSLMFLVGFYVCLANVMPVIAVEFSFIIFHLFSLFYRFFD